MTYQDSAAATAIFPGQGSVVGKMYCALGLFEETIEVKEALDEMLKAEGHIAGKTKKEYRDNTPYPRDLLIKELGDVLWYLAVFAKQHEITLEEIAEENLKKLASRKARGVLQGSGDMR